MNDIEKFTMTPKEAGRYIGISENKIRKLCNDRKIKAAKSGSHWKIPRSSLEEYVMEAAEKGESL